MRQLYIHILLLVCIPTTLSAQLNQDTIFTFRPDTIVCKFDHMDDDYVYYIGVEQKINQVLSKIDREEVANIVIDHERYYDLSKLPQASDSEEESVHFLEGDGIIFPSHLDSPPVFQGGEMDMLRYLQSHVRSQAEHAEMYGNSYIKVLFEATIDSLGAIRNVTIAESSISTGNYAEDEIAVEHQINNVISEMPAWTPAVYKGRNATVEIYIPVKFRIEQYAIIMYSGKHAFVFNNTK